ncbi:MAG: hypothetical protein HOH19_06005 [Kordiimonadaceae bacterium]|mgnify:CR=1 FL=1|jgi:hypothetical protein|nr:hypothetical protein [Kordiimonadaceae bacterium]MBT6032111.1 hypothetical protein [Kordiimonadaceae bacterium]
MLFHRFKSLHKIETHKEILYKFLILLSILILYFGYMSIEYGILTGGLVAALTWSFFVLCTPIADAGFLLDLPIRLLFGFRMLYSEILVWVIAIALNGYAILYNQEAYDKTIVTMLFKKILLTPFPYWSVLVLSGIGTFLSIYFGDEMLDVLRHRDRVKYHQHAFKLKLIGLISLFLLIFLAYYFLLESLNLQID